MGLSFLGQAQLDAASQVGGRARCSHVAWGAVRCSLGGVVHIAQLAGRGRNGLPQPLANDAVGPDLDLGLHTMKAAACFTSRCALHPLSWRSW
eukprot:347464-Chlamydomonas_euryale.AAC.10